MEVKSSMVELAYNEYIELEEWMCQVYGGCLLTRELVETLAWLGIPERRIEGVSVLLKTHIGEYCDEVFEEIDSDIRIV